ncbi:MAG: hypothetical protein AUJ92_04320 [Armatimonadetes bacterium CG2_30_59_28]|nr:YfhO family protein [Armatimonadota bacterium]OIO97085.1 MAG: hypothetical protein AUJ92_04320 [Armatimonadetes bacterium CG2_30_59_28]PIU64057.1 MAG: hypothetical protein COS85_13965 [Armatimonadetes bacterium CG07_land_8_20_14_0_80_59_28]
MVLHYLLASLFMYLLARHFGLRPTSAVLSGIVFAYSSHVVRHLFHMAYLNAVVWLPLIFLMLDRFRKSGRRTDLAGFVLCFAIQIFTGHLQVVFITSVGAFSYLAACIVSGRSCRRQLLFSVLPAILLIGGITAVHWIPLAQVTKESVRQRPDRALSLMLSMPPEKWVGLLSQRRADDLRPSGEPELLWEAACYVGVLPPLLSLISFWGLRNGKAKYLALLAVTAGLLAMGGYTPIYAFIAHLPPFSFMRAPSKFLLLFTFAVAVLAGFGVDRLSAWRKLSWAPSVAIIIVCMDLFVANAGFNKLTSPSFYTQPPRFRDMMVSTGRKQFRVFTHVDYARIRHAQNLEMEGATLDKETLYGNTGMMYGFESLAGYTPLSPLRVRHYGEALFSVVRNEQGEAMGIHSPAKLLGIANCRYVVSSTPLPPWDFDQVATWGEVALYENRLCLPRAWLMHKAVADVPEGDILEYMNSDSFDPRRTTIVEVENELPQLDPLPRWGEGANPKGSRVRGKDGFSSVTSIQERSGDEAVRMVDDAPSHVTLSVNAASRAILVLADRYTADWRATVDGIPAEVYRTNYLFRAVVVPAGEHQVVFSYRPVLFYIGATLSALTLIALVAFLHRSASFWKFPHKRTPDRFSVR